MLEIQIIGNLGIDAEQISTGWKVRIANTAKVKNGDSTFEKTTWITAFVGEEKHAIIPYLLKGTKIFARGPISVRAYKGNDGEYHAGISMRVNQIELCGGTKYTAGDTHTHTTQEERNRDGDNMPF